MDLDRLTKGDSCLKNASFCRSYRYFIDIIIIDFTSLIISTPWLQGG